MKLVEGRKDQIITLSVAPCIPKGIGVEITDGCANGCIYCFSACSGSSEMKNEVVCYQNCANMLEDFLSQHVPTRIHLGYVTDFLGGASEVRKEVYTILQKHLQIPVSMLTKGVMSSMDIDNWLKIGNRATIMIDAGAEDLRWETNVKSFGERLDSAKWLIGHCDVNIRVDPIIPGVNDSDKYFHSVLGSMQRYGLHNVDCSFLFLTEPVIEAIEIRFGEDYAEEMQIKYYHNDEEECLNSSVPWTGREVDLKSLDMEDIRYQIDLIPLPTPDTDYRLRILQQFQTLGEKCGVEVRLCTCKNRSLVGHAGSCSDARRQGYLSKYYRLRKVVEQLWESYRESDRKVIKPPDLRRITTRYIEIFPTKEDRITVKKKLKPVLEDPLLFTKSIEKDNCGIHWKVYQII